jgi:hypothetical protein
MGSGPQLSVDELADQLLVSDVGQVDSPDLGMVLQAAVLGAALLGRFKE